MTFHHFKSAAILLVVGAVGSIAGCTSSTSEESRNVVVNVPIVYTKRAVSAVGDPLDPVTFGAGGDLMYKAVASPRSEQINITAGYTKGGGDVADPEVYFDATRVLFAMKGPDDATWNIWEWYMDPLTVPSNRAHTIAAGGGLGMLARVINDDAIADAGDDIDPAYLPGGKIVFASNRQQISGVDGKQRDEYERRTSTLLHVMNPASTDNVSGGNNAFIDQISFNQSHDRDAIVLDSGEILFSRWDHLGPKNHFPLFRVNPDGTGIFIKYGAFSAGNSRLHPRVMPSGPYKGQIIASLMPLQGTQEGGALVLMDVNNYAENGQQLPDPFKEITFNTRTMDDPTAVITRLSTPYPLRDNTNRVFMAFSRFDPTTVEQPPVAEGEEMEIEVMPRYGIQVFDLDSKTNRWITQPPSDPGFVYFEPVSIESRPVPTEFTRDSKKYDAGLGNQGQVAVLSIYDTDGLQVMNRARFTASERTALHAVETASEKIIAADGEGDNSVNIENMVKLTGDNPDARPARFFRILKAVVGKNTGMNIGIEGNEMKQIVGYGVVEPDGSLKFNMQADTAFGISILDNKGRSFQTHLSWLQVRPGEKLTCTGCHSPRRRTDDPLNTGSLFSQLPNPPAVGATSIAQGTETLATVRSHEDNSGVTGMGAGSLDLKASPATNNYWSTVTNTTKDLSFDTNLTTLIHDYATKQGNNTTQADAIVAALNNGIINFTQHIYPIIEARCAQACHQADPTTGFGSDGNLILTADPDVATGRYTAYEQLVQERLNVVDGVPVADDPATENVQENELTPLVNGGGNAGVARGSRLFEVLYGEELFADGSPALAAGTQDHAAILSPSELRLLSEWADIGAQYYNDPDLGGGVVISESRLNETAFNDTINPILLTDCGECHLAGNNQAHSFVLTTGREMRGNFNVTANFINGLDPLKSMLLTMPTQGDTGAAPATQSPTVTHPTKVWDPSNIHFQTVRDWIVNSLNGN